MSQELSPIKDKILATIQTGQIKMRPRWHFILQTALILSGITIVILALLFIVSFIIFSLRQSGVWFAPYFGYRGLGTFLISLPWLLIGLSIVFIVVLEVLVKRYSFAYRQPLLYSALALVLVVTIGGIALAQTPLHRGIMLQTRDNHLPLATPLYNGFGMKKPDGIHAGSIKEMTKDGFVLSSRRNESLQIIVTPETQLPTGYDLIEGDMVVIMGERDDNTIQAFGIREISAMPGEFVPRHQFPQRFRPPLPN